jgi:hypothetical protein
MKSVQQEQTVGPASLPGRGVHAASSDGELAAPGFSQALEMGMVRRPKGRAPAAVLALLFAAAAGFAASKPAPAPESPPSTPREFYNAGTQRLHDGKLREAEAFLESALASQVEAIQPSALFNLGHVRFSQGVEELKKGPGAKSTIEGSRRTLQMADEAIKSADASLAGNDLDQLVASYMHGRGARKELKAATTAVRRALDSHRATLTKWQRSSDDFKSAVELKRTDADAAHNAETVDRCIAKLVDSIHELQLMANALSQKKQELGEKMQKLKGKIPAPDMPPGAAGDEDEEEENQPNGPQPGQQEGPTKDGEEMHLSPEQASWLLNGFKLDGDRRLPMGGDQATEPKDRKRPTW